MTDSYPLGKLPPEILAALLAGNAIDDPRVVVGPRPGEDTAVLDVGGSAYLVAKTDPITFATDEIGWYAVHVNANDIAATGGTPEWFMATLLLPEGTSQVTVATLFGQIKAACESVGAVLVGGHTEITYGLDRPIVIGMMLGLAPHGRLVTTGGAQAGDVLLVTKGVPVEATAIIAREKADMLAGRFNAEMLDRCAGYLHTPGISVAADARIAQDAGQVHAMHDPTEGGLATGLWEMAEAADKRLVVDLGDVVLPDGQALCDAVGIDPLGAIASGALLIAVHPDDAEKIGAALTAEGIPAIAVGRVEDGPAQVVTAAGDLLDRPARDEIARLFE
jgi:hydrogenase expression/formation protein HypE